jgi:hypothetical protein
MLSSNERVFSNSVFFFFSLTYSFCRSRHDFERTADAKGGRLNLDDFIVFVEHHHTLLFPVFEIQLTLRNRILGQGFWDEASKRRIQISKGKYLPVRDIIELESLHQPANLLTKANDIDTAEGKLALSNLGNAHNRRMKYSNDETFLSPESEPPALYPSAVGKENIFHFSFLVVGFYFYLFVFAVVC